jgi:hypothetical protein
LNRCLTSLAGQLLAAQMEIIMADNASTDCSNLLAADSLRYHGLGLPPVDAK